MLFGRQNKTVVCFGSHTGLGYGHKEGINLDIPGLHLDVDERDPCPGKTSRVMIFITHENGASVNESTSPLSRSRQ